MKHGGVISRRGARTLVERDSEIVRRSVGQQLATLRHDSGVSQRSLAKTADVPQSFVSRIERGLAEPSTQTIVALARALGAEVSVRLNPGTGPRIRDRIQARVVEELIRVSRGSWRALAEVPVWRPVRGVIDLVLARPGEIAVACEVHSEVHRLEQLLRWQAAKADALPSSTSWSMITSGHSTIPVSRLLVLRSTRSSRDIGRQFEATLSSAYPSRATDAFAALIDSKSEWPGAAVIWADVRSREVRLLAHPPRGVRVGR